MPIYEYICPKCGRHEERIQPFTAKKTLPCPCGQSWMERDVPRIGGFDLKGTGWTPKTLTLDRLAPFDEVNARRAEKGLQTMKDDE